jgi:TonB family protein
MTANDSFKTSSANWTKIGLIGAVILHTGLFALVEPFEAADLGALAAELEAVHLPPEVKIPPPPERIARPATPRVSAVDVGEEVTIPETTWEKNPVESLPRPPVGESPSDRPSFIPFDTPPRLRNAEQVERFLLRFYPRNLKDAGIGGRVELWLYVNAQGLVEKSQVESSSGNAALDEAARRVASEMRFAPAKNRDKVVAVWVHQPITFKVR